MIDWARAVRVGVVTDDEADALAGALHDVGNGVVLIDRRDLADDELEACSRVCVWMESTGGVQ